MNWIRGFYLLFITLVPGFLLHAQDLNKGFFKVEHSSLSTRSVASIIKDSRGFMWFGTAEGLCRFDGTHIKVYKHHPHDSTSLCHNEVIALVEDAQQNLWVGTANGLNRYNRETDNFANVEVLSKNGTLLTNRFITSLAADDAGQIWIGTISGGVNIFNTRSLTLTHRLGINNETYNASAVINTLVVHNGHAWIATRAGLHILDTHTTGPVPVPGMDDNLLKKEVSAAINSHKGTLLLGFTDGQIKEISIQNNAAQTRDYYDLKTVTGAASHIHKLSEDNAGNLWIVTEKSGLVVIDAAGKKIMQHIPEEGNPHSAPALSLRTVYCDAHRVWVGTYNLGVYLIDPHTKKFELYQRNPLVKTSLRDNTVRAFAEDNHGNLWIAGNAGINTLDIESRQLANPQQINNRVGGKVIKDLLIDHDNNLWIGTRDDGVIKLNLKTGTGSEYSMESTGTGNNKVLCLYQDNTQTIWAGTLGSGLFYFDKSGNRFVSAAQNAKTTQVPATSYVMSIVEHDGKLWVGTLNGLFVRSRNAAGTYTYKAYYQHNQQHGLSSSRIMVLYEDPAQTLWVGTYDNGLNRYVKARDAFEAYTEENGLANNSVKGMIADSKGNLWISTGAGITTFDPNAKTSKNYTKEDGLNSNTFNPNSCLRLKTGHFVFGGDNGFNIFHPDSIHGDPAPPTVHLTGFKINNKEVRIGSPDSPLQKHIGFTKQINLTHDQRSFSIDFVALNYGPSSRNQYCYRLEGFEQAWNCIGSDQTATYTNIDAGTYTFFVKGSNGDGVWSAAPARVEIIIHPPLWQTWWAKLVYAVVLGAVIYLIFKIRIDRIHFKSELKLEKMAREKEHELTESKMHFFTNISHELRTPLSLILMPLEKIAASPEVPDKIKISLSNAHRNATNLIRLVNQLMDISKFDEVKPALHVQQVECIRFMAEAATHFNDLAEKKNIALILQAEEPEIHGWIDADKVEKIVHNLLSNAFKFTHNHGKISVVMRTIGPKENTESAGEHIEITVTDSGIGIAPEELPRIFDKFYQAKSAAGIAHTGTGIGLSLTKTLVAVHHGTIVVESTPGAGTKFVVCLPIARAAFTETELDNGRAQVTTGSGHMAPDYEQITIDQNLGKPELLIIEDNDELRNSIAVEFSTEFSIIQAATAEDGFMLACEKVPDLILSDIVLPGNSGLEVCKELKTDLRTSHIPVILLTAKTSAEDQIIGFESGADIYIPKPFSLRVLKAQVKQTITARRKLYTRFSQDAYLMPANLTDNAVDKEFLKKALDYVNGNLRNPQLSVESLADLFNISRSQVYRKVKALTGQTVVELIRMVRLKYALKLMEEKKHNLSEIADLAGFNSLSYFTRSFKDQYGKAPSEYL
jgi:signal transduction histidine kinase/ligand-binding sensor domain-containing protein/DNA-binding response OmpR family regulator